MSEHNFVTTLSVQQQKEIRVWWVYSLLLLIISIVLLLVLDGIYMQQWWQLRTTYQNDRQAGRLFDELVVQKKELINGIAHFAKQNAKIVTYQKQIKNPYPLLQALLELSTQVQLDSVIIEHKKIRLEVGALNEAQLIAWSDELKKIPYLTNIQLQQLHKVSPQKYAATINAVLKY